MQGNDVPKQESQSTHSWAHDWELSSAACRMLLFRTQAAHLQRLKYRHPTVPNTRKCTRAKQHPCQIAQATRQRNHHPKTLAHESRYTVFPRSSGIVAQHHPIPLLAQIASKATLVQSTCQSSTAPLRRGLSDLNQCAARAATCQVQKYTTEI